MANFIYNGVELPDINTVWTDKETYPYAYLYAEAGYLILSDVPMRIRVNTDGSTGYLYFYEATNYRTYYKSDEQWVFQGSGTGKAGKNGFPTWDNYSYIWSNYDVLTQDNTVYYAASTPIRADSKLKISVGGEVLFDGSLTTTKTTWNSCDLIEFSVGDNLTIIYDGVAYNCTATGRDTSAFVGEIDADTLNVSFVNIPFAFLCGSDKCYVLTETLGTHTFKITKTSTSHVYYEGTEPCAYSSVFGAYVSAELLNEPGPSVGDTVYVIWDGVLYEDVVTTAAAFGNAPMFGDLTLSTRPYVIGYMDIDGNGEAGWFFATGTSGEHTLKVYSVIEGGEVTATTANVVFTCTNLENTEPIDCIKAWVYKKSDGLNTTIPPTWTSEMFSAPEYSTTHTFTGLTPNTEYEVYGCIFVNGEATDHNAIAEFTTLEGSGDLKPVYKRESGKWVKKTAYERQNSEWVLISTAT